MTRDATFGGAAGAISATPKWDAFIASLRLTSEQRGALQRNCEIAFNFVKRLDDVEFRKLALSGSKFGEVMDRILSNMFKISDGDAPDQGEIGEGGISVKQPRVENETCEFFSVTREHPQSPGKQAFERAPSASIGRMPSKAAFGELVSIEAVEGGALLLVRFGDTDARVFTSDPRFLAEGLNVVAAGRARRIEIVEGGAN